ncbi:hypothetical protein G6F62_015050 [Rhizopus arrhizus]|nr:hypothetical protein G6F62_015050 [Rhizopus arrhizus]KAG1606195.1 hypothetical protein G6F45_014037 [Rhizopus arrhizus]
MERGHDPARDRAADQARHGHGGHEERRDATASRRRIPVGQVKDDAGEEAGLGRAQQEAQRIEHVDAGHEHHAGGDDPPG